jgi:hypothetical protein
MSVYAAYADQLETDGGRIAVESSNLLYVAYQADFRRLFVWFGAAGKPITRYAYDDVSADLFDQLVASSSKGKFLDSRVKKQGYVTHGPF